jgi:hypothetical protein
VNFGRHSSNWTGMNILESVILRLIMRFMSKVTQTLHSHVQTLRFTEGCGPQISSQSAYYSALTAFLFFFQAMNFLVESFGLLNDLFPFPSILDAGYPVLIFIWQMSCLMLSSHLYLCLPCGLLVRGFQLNIFLTVLISGILFM